MSSGSVDTVVTTTEERADIDGIEDAFARIDCASPAQCLNSHTAALRSARIDPELLQWEAYYAVASQPGCSQVVLSHITPLTVHSEG